MAKPGSIHTFISYKGGTGRTTTCANVAYHAARQGMRVLVADLDIDGPGMAVLADITNDDMAEHSIVRYLASGVEAAPADFILRREFPIPGGNTAVIDFMVAPLSYDPSDALPTFGEGLPAKMSRFRNELRLKYDLIFLDSASGVSDYTALAFSISDFVSICFRWGRQHVLGSVKLLRLLGGIRRRRLSGGGLFLEDFCMVGTAVPPPETDEQRQRASDVLETFSGIMGQIRQQEVRGADEIRLINEFNILKWGECIVTERGEAFAQFARVADMVMARHDRWGGGDE
ncbi:ATPase involved in chromosome partitioning [Paramagnetospirillum caucaseum]|uniref:ATPase involved in chromosome partitioning n=1 Tax=Paramagnetospirillum caucaseum TaxID=1244869 RepID=M2Y3U9_9PROT|nr:ParA family protein [Paramagnetospirillum caucaseum]EME67761.1 ATPase involved in chromosome partitioning [Paramagnetospirillum caucaseum]